MPIPPRSHFFECLADQPQPAERTSPVTMRLLKVVPVSVGAEHWLPGQLHGRRLNPLKSLLDNRATLFDEFMFCQLYSQL